MCPCVYITVGFIVFKVSRAGGSSSFSSSGQICSFIFLLALLGDTTRDRSKRNLDTRRFITLIAGADMLEMSKYHLLYTAQPQTD